jgi:uncharacterized SAM-binding protein YcdF (DUF218 family)
MEQVADMYQLFVWEFLQPYAILFLVTGFALLRLWHRRQETRARLLWVSVPFAILFVISLPAVADPVLGSLEWKYPPLGERPADVQAIVVLASYVYPPAGEGGLPELDESTANRCRMAAQLYRQGRAIPVLATGGSANPGKDPVCAVAMRDFLVQLGVPAADVVVEGDSQTTYENAVNSKKILAERGISRVVLLTDAAHLYRSVGCFRKQGLEVIPCGCRYRAEYLEFSLAKFLPKVRAVEACQRACHEWLGVLWYWLRGRL